MSLEVDRVSLDSLLQIINHVAGYNKNRYKHVTKGKNVIHSLSESILIVCIEKI